MNSKRALQECPDVRKNWHPEFKAAARRSFDAKVKLIRLREELPDELSETIEALVDEIDEANQLTEAILVEHIDEGLWWRDWLWFQGNGTHWEDDLAKVRVKRKKAGEIIDFAEMKARFSQRVK